ncbi:ABC transporter ATP-binding protein [Vallitalea sediminicola]
MTKKQKKDKIPFKKVMHLSLRGYHLWWKKYPMMLCSSALCSISVALTPYVAIILTARIINEIAGERDAFTLKWLTVLSLISASVLALLNAGLSRWKNYERKALWYKRDKLYTDKLLSMNFSDVGTSRTHDLMDKIQQNDSWPAWGLGGLMGDFDLLVESLLTIIGAVALSSSLFMFKVPESAGTLTVLNNPFFIIIIIAVMLAVTFAVPMLINKGNAYWANYYGDITMFEKYRIFIVKSSQERQRALDTRIYRQDIMGQKYLDEAMSYGDRATTVLRPMRLFHTSSTAVSHVFTIIIYIFVCLKAWGGAYGVGFVTQYIGATTALSGGVSGLLRFFGNLRNNAPFLQTVFDFLATPNDMCQGSLSTGKRSNSMYEIEFRNVSFKYPSSEEYVMKNLSLKFNIGQRLAVVGQNGSGKTTFIKLLCRLYDPTEGEIYLNGIDIRQYDYREYMDIFSVVFQDFKLLSFSLGQNVAAEADYDAVWANECLNKTGFGERLQTLPKGLDTCMYKDFEKEGVDISEGEAQKIALARALYKDAPFVIMDEPTASLDPIAESEVYEKMNEIVGDKTAVFISHRLSSCRFCNDIVVFHEGRLIQHGSHDNLVADKEGKYYELWNAQAQYYTT